MNGSGGLAIARDNARLISAALAGDRSSFDLLVQDHGPRIFRLALRMLGNREEAEDVQQETFLQAYRNLHKFRGESSFATWLYSIAAHLCLSRRRRAARCPREAAQEADDLADAREDTQEQIRALEAAVRVQAALAKLPPPERLLLVLKFIEELSHEEIAHILGCSVESSRSRLLRAKRRFREQYENME